MQKKTAFIAFFILLKCNAFAESKIYDYVFADIIYIRGEPSYDSPVIGRMTRGYRYRPFESADTDKWKLISSGGTIGYIDYEKSKQKNFVDFDPKCYRFPNGKIKFEEGAIGGGRIGSFVVFRKNGFFEIQGECFSEGYEFKGWTISGNRITIKTGTNNSIVLQLYKNNSFIMYINFLFIHPPTLQNPNREEKEECVKEIIMGCMYKP